MFRTLLDSSPLVMQADLFRRRLDPVKAEVDETGFPWYSYDSYGGLEYVDQLLQGPFRNLLHDARGSRVLDLGCADGELTFFLESAGFQVIAVDHPDTNCNSMRGIRKLKQALQAKAEIIAADLDSHFDLPAGPYELAIVLGILYHLKNPYYLLDWLSRNVRLCLLSTRVARFTPEGTPIRDTPVAYLLDPTELNEDRTNYWIFSEAGLKRLLSRAGWQVCRFLTTGDQDRSLPNVQEQDERAFCLIRNRRLTDPALTARLLEGWHGLEDGHRRWTAQAFSAEIPTPDPNANSVLELVFVHPDVSFERIGAIQVRAIVGETALPARTYTSSGEHIYRAQVPPGLLQNPATLVRFELDRAIPPDSIDRRERGLIALSVGLQ